MSQEVVRIADIYEARVERLSDGVVGSGKTPHQAAGSTCTSYRHTPTLQPPPITNHPAFRRITPIQATSHAAGYINRRHSSGRARVDPSGNICSISPALNSGNTSIQFYLQIPTLSSLPPGLKPKNPTTTCTTSCATPTGEDASSFLSQHQLPTRRTRTPTPHFIFILHIRCSYAALQEGHDEPLGNPLGKPERINGRRLTPFSGENHT